MSGQLATLNGMNLQSMGEVMVKSGFFQDTREAAHAIVKIQAGAEIGFPPVASMTGVYIVKGKVSLSANLMAAAIKRYDGGKYNYRIKRHDPDVCEIEFSERGQPVGTSTFTRQDAAKAGTQNMDRFPRNMLFARAMSNGAKWFCPDVFGGPVYTPDELGEEVNSDGEPVRVSAPQAPALPVRETPVRDAPQLPAAAKAEPSPKVTYCETILKWSGVKREDMRDACEHWRRHCNIGKDLSTLTDEEYGRLTDAANTAIALGEKFEAALAAAQ